MNIKRYMILFLLGCCGCLQGCSMTLDGPAKAFGVGTQKDRTAHIHKGLFSASADIPLTDLSGEGWEIGYNKETGTFTLKLNKFDQNWSNTLTLENARIKDNQELYKVLTAAQQEVYDRKIDAWKEFGNHAIDAAAQAIATIANMPGGAPIADGLKGSLLKTVAPEMVPMLKMALTKYGL